MAKTKTKKNPVAVDKETQEHKEYLKEIRRAAKRQNIPLSVYKKLLKISKKDGRFIFFDRKTYEYIQAETIVDGHHEALKELSKNLSMIDLESSDGLYTQTIGVLLEER